MGDAIEARELDPLGVHEQQAEPLRRVVEEERGQHGIQAGALAGAGSTGKEKMGHADQVGYHGAARDVPPEGQAQGGTAFLERVGLEHPTEPDYGLFGVRHLDADHCTAGHRSLDANRRCGQRQRQVV